MAFTLPTFDDLKSEILGRWRSFLTGVSTAQGSDADIKSETLAHVIHGLHLHLRYGVLNNLLPTKASGIFLDAWMYLFGLSDGSGGYGRIKTRGSSGTDALTITATASATVDYDLQDEEFTDSAGQRYKIAQSIMQHTVWAAASHEYDVDVEAIDTGLSTNIEVSAGEVFQWVTPPDSMSTTLTQVVDFDGGADRETDSAGRVRLQIYLQAPPQGGNWANWVQWIEDASPGALKAYVWPQREFSDVGYGYGCVDFCAFQVGESGTARHIAGGTALYTAIDTYIASVGPARMVRNARQLTITSVPSNINVTLEMNTSAANDDLCDWDAESVKRTVAVGSEATLTITASGNICSPTVTGGIEVGDRVLIRDEEAVVASVNVGADAKVFTVESWPWTGGIAAYYIMSGGGIIKTVVDALRSYADGIGPAKGSYAAPVPGWDDTLRLASIKSTVIVAGEGTAVDMTINLPAADVAPGYDDDSDVDAVVVDEIAVWEPK